MSDRDLIRELHDRTKFLKDRVLALTEENHELREQVQHLIRTVREIREGSA